MAGRGAQPGPPASRALGWARPRQALCLMGSRREVGKGISPRCPPFAPRSWRVPGSVALGPCGQPCWLLPLPYVRWSLVSPSTAFLLSLLLGDGDRPCCHLSACVPRCVLARCRCPFLARCPAWSLPFPASRPASASQQAGEGRLRRGWVCWLETPRGAAGLKTMLAPGQLWMEGLGTDGDWKLGGF